MIMSTDTQERVTLREPATTRDGLRAQAALLNISGRGAMNKAELHTAVSEGIALMRAEYEAARVLIEQQEKAVRQAALDAATVNALARDAERNRAIAATPPPVEYIHIDVNPVVAEVIRAALGEDTRPEVPSPLTVAARLNRTRTGRRDYPAGKAVRRHKRRDGK
jgi:hypothetical protein